MDKKNGRNSRSWMKRSQISYMRKHLWMICRLLCRCLSPLRQKKVMLELLCTTIIHNLSFLVKKSKYKKLQSHQILFGKIDNSHQPRDWLKSLSFWLLLVLCLLAQEQPSTSCESSQIISKTSIHQQHARTLKLLMKVIWLNGKQWLLKKIPPKSWEKNLENQHNLALSCNATAEQLKRRKD